MNQEKFDWPGHLGACVDSTFYCALSTHGSETPWVNPVFFSHDDKYSLLFISLPTARHMINIDRNSRVSVAIFSTAQPPGGDVRGIQIGGVATKLRDDEVALACSQYFARPGAAIAIGVDQPDPADYQGNAADTWKFVRVTPTEMWYFDTRYFGEERVAVPDLLWQPDR